MPPMGLMYIGEPVLHETVTGHSELDDIPALEKGQVDTEFEPQQSYHLQEFTCFPNLPFEIRTEIWRLSAPARLVEIYFLMDVEDQDEILPITTTPLPTLAHVCHESREIFCREYFLCVETEEGATPPYINPSIDILWINTTSEWNIGARQFDIDNCLSEVFENIKIRRLAIDHQMLVPLTTHTPHRTPLLKYMEESFPGLEELVFMVPSKGLFPDRAACSGLRRSESTHGGKEKTMFPETESELAKWEYYMCALGYLQRSDETEFWKKLRMSVAFLKPAENGTWSDLWEGSTCFGPPNEWL